MLPRKTYREEDLQREEPFVVSMDMIWIDPYLKEFE